MSDLKDRVGVLTGGNANLIPNAGDLITGDGTQTVYLRADGVVDGMVLTRDSTVEEGLSWQPGGGGGGAISDVTGADGITVTTPSLGVRQVHSSVVTGDAIANFDAHITGAGSDAVITTIDGDISISAAGGATDNGDLNLTSDTTTGTTDINGGTTVLHAANALNLAPSNNASITATTGGTGNINLTSGHSMSVTVTGGGAAANLGVTVDRDMNVATGRNFNVTASGSSGINLNVDSPTNHVLVGTAGGPITLRSTGPGAINIQHQNGSTDVGNINITNDANGAPGTSDINIAQTAAGAINLSTASGSAIATINGAIHLEALGDVIEFVSNVSVSVQPGGNPFKIFGGAGAAQHAAIIDAAGGAVQDAECRTAVNTILAALRVWGFVHT